MGKVWGVLMVLTHGPPHQINTTLIFTRGAKARSGKQNICLSFGFADSLPRAQVWLSREWADPAGHAVTCIYYMVLYCVYTKTAHTLWVLFTIISCIECLV